MAILVAMLVQILCRDIFGQYENFSVVFDKHPHHLPKKSWIREKKHLLTDADSSTDPKKNPASKAKFMRQFYTIYEQKFSNLSPLLSITFPQGFPGSKIFGHWTSGSGGKKTFKRSDKKFSNLRPLFLI